MARTDTINLERCSNQSPMPVATGTTKDENRGRLSPGLPRKKEEGLRELHRLRRRSSRPTFVPGEGCLEGYFRTNDIL